MNAHVSVTEGEARQKRDNAGGGKRDRECHCFLMEKKRNGNFLETDVRIVFHFLTIPFLAIAMNAGMPMIAVMTPTGSSSGWMTKRAAISAARRRIAPITAL